MAVNSNGSVGIAYAGIDGNLHYASNNTTWTDVIVDESSPGAINNPTLIFDNNDKPLICYYDRDTFWGSAVKVAGIGIKKYRLADLTGDGEVNLDDWAILASQWQMTGWYEHTADINRSGVVNAADLHIMAIQWLE
jgi:hypothetical protein